MAFIITGDTHGTLDIGKVVQFFNDHEDEFGVPGTPGHGSFYRRQS